jgi:hypothetical protein
MVTYTGEILNSSASDEYDRVLLQIVSDTGDIGCNLDPVRKSYPCDFSLCRVRLLRSFNRNLVQTPLFCGEAALTEIFLIRFTLFCKAGAFDL